MRNDCSNTPKISGDLHVELPAVSTNERDLTRDVKIYGLRRLVVEWRLQDGGREHYLVLGGTEIRVHGLQ